MTIYWQSVLDEVRHRKTRGYFLFTNFGELQLEVLKQQSLSIINNLESNQRYLLGEKYPGVHLSRREAECVLHLLRGKSLKRIGTLLELSHRTVEYYIKNVKKKLMCRTRFELVDLVLASDFLNNVDF